MMLAPTLAGNTARTAARNGLRTRGYLLDAILLGLAGAVATAFIFQGGLEVLLGAMTGAVVGARGSAASAISGAFAGLFAGLMCAGFFHDALATFVRSLF